MTSRVATFTICVNPEADSRPPHNIRIVCDDLVDKSTETHLENEVTEMDLITNTCEVPDDVTVRIYYDTRYIKDPLELIRLPLSLFQIDR